MIKLKQDTVSSLTVHLLKITNIPRALCTCSIQARVASTSKAIFTRHQKPTSQCLHTDAAAAGISNNDALMTLCFLLNNPATHDCFISIPNVILFFNVKLKNYIIIISE